MANNVLKLVVVEDALDIGMAVLPCAQATVLFLSRVISPASGASTFVILESYGLRSRRFDTPTFFGRNIQKCKDFAQTWYGKVLNPITDKVTHDELVQGFSMMRIVIGPPENHLPNRLHVSHLKPGAVGRHQQLRPRSRIISQSQASKNLFREALGSNCSTRSRWQFSSSIYGKCRRLHCSKHSLRVTNV